MVLGELGVLLTSEMLPDTLPVAVGANCTLKLLDCPAARVSGKVSPLMLKPAPVKLACAMVKLALPELVKVRFCTPLLPTSTLPKLTLGGATERCGCTTQPLRAMVLGGLGALLTIETLPDTLKETAAAEIYTLALHYALPILSGKVSPLMLKPAPVKLACAMVKLALPELVKVRFCTPLLPTSTLPKLTL